MNNMTAKEFWKNKFDEYPQNDAEKLAVVMMAEYAAHSNEGLKIAAKEILHLHLCEQEGLLSGKPTPLQWLYAVDELSKALNQQTKA